MIELFLASFTFITIKAFQQLNVVHGEYIWVVPTSLLMAVAEATVIIKVATISNLTVCIPMGVGGGLGAMTAMYIHNRYVRKRP